MIEFPLLDIWSKFHRKVIVSYYTQSCAHSKEISETEHSVHGTARRLKVRPSARAASQLSHLAWENVTTDITRGGPVCSDRPWTAVHGRLYNIYYTDVHATGPGHPLCRRLAAVQPSR